jgi:LPXTG-motif cell wall-anchored protein
MIWLSLVGIALLAAFFFLFLRRNAEGQSGHDVVSRANGRRPRSVARPSDTPVRTEANGIEAQMLRVPDLNRACEAARHYVGRTLDAATAPKLPLPGCGVVECRCRYERVVNLRRKERREVTARRDEIRFETKIDRRAKPDRRIWNAFWDKFRRR